MSSVPKSEIVGTAGQGPMTYSKELAGAGTEYERAQLVFGWLCDDEHRPALYAELRANESVLMLKSAAPPPMLDPAKTPGPLCLLTGTEDIAAAMTHFSNVVYREIGSGGFVLGLDPGPHHDDQRKYLIGALRTDPLEMQMIAALSCLHAMVAPTKGENFDLISDVAEQAALRFTAAYFGFPDSDHYLLQETLRQGLDGMILQMFGRHFVTEPTMPTTSKLAMGKLTQRIGELIEKARTSSLTPEVFTAVQAGADAAPAALATFARTLGALEPKAAANAEAYATRTGDPGLGQRTAVWLDEALNYGKVRAGIDAPLLALPEAMRGPLTEVIGKMIRKKQGPDDYLVPRRLLLAGGVPDWQDTTSDYRFRQTFIDKLAHGPAAGYSSLDLAVGVIGTIAGLIGNIIAGSSVTINEFFRLKDKEMIDEVKARAVPFIAPTPQGLADAIKSAASLVPFVNEAMRLQPPAAFLPRTKVSNAPTGCPGLDALAVGTEVIIPIGAVTRDTQNPDAFDEKRAHEAAFDYVLGHPDDKSPASHRCIGGHIATPLISHIVRSVLALPGLARQYVNGKPTALKKKWGYICQSFPLRYDRDQRLVQHPLNVIMKIRQPTSEHAEKLKLTIRYGAPAIEQLLIRSKIVHFARFVFLNNDTELALLTSYDGRFEDYIRYFALAAGPMFDLIFEHIEEPPPMPVREHPTKFVEHIRRFDVAPAQNYFFSAYPTRKVTNYG
jgi:cytochrome P450